MLRTLRIIAALVLFLGITLYFVDFARFLPTQFSWLERIQLVPALKSHNWIIIGSLLGATILLGRIYCSTLCPLGVLQDVINAIAKRIHAKKKFEYKKPVPCLRLVVLLLFLVGAAVSIPLHLLEDQIASKLDTAFSAYYSFSPASGLRIYKSETARLAHYLLYSFAGVACVEELVKWFIVFFITNKSKDFNCLFDGIVYHVFYAFGFALAETLRYTYHDGFGMMAMRAFTVVPSHLLFAIVSGFFYTLWNCYRKAAQRELSLIDSRAYSTRRIKIAPLLFALGIIIPVLLHTLCTLTNLYTSRDLQFAYFCIVVLLYALCFFIVHQMSKCDSENSKLADVIIQRVHSRDSAK